MCADLHDLVDAPDVLVCAGVGHADLPLVYNGIKVGVTHGVGGAVKGNSAL